MRTNSFPRFARRYAHRFGAGSAVSEIHDQGCGCERCAALDQARAARQGITPVRLRDSFAEAGYVADLAALYLDTSAYDGRLQVAYLRLPCTICLHSCLRTSLLSWGTVILTCPYCQGTGYREGGPV